MNEYVKKFLHRGLIFGGFGPIIMGIVFWILELTLPELTLSGGQMLLAIASTYLLAFIHAGASVFNQIEEWPITKSLLCHFVTLFVAYSLCYISNSWIAFEPMVLLIFCLIFVVTYFIVWGTVYFAVKATAKRCNSQLK